MRKKEYRPSGRLRLYFIWLTVIGLFITGLTVYLLLQDVKAGLIMACLTAVYWGVYLYENIVFKPTFMRDLIEFSSNYAQVQKELLDELEIPYCLLDGDGDVLYLNNAMLDLTGKKKGFRQTISVIFPEITLELLPQDNEKAEVSMRFNERDYRAEMKRIPTERLTSDTKILQAEKDSVFIALYLFDTTEINSYKQMTQDNRFVAALVDIDNYEEVVEQIDDVRRSLFVGLVDKRVNQYFASGGAIVRKLEKDRYLAVFRNKYLDELEVDRFRILDDIKNLNIGNDMSLTLSIGVGTGAADYSANFDMARDALNLALGRGGDQAVVRRGDKVTYYGGSTQQMEKNTRVKVRMKANALKQILEGCSNVLIMGHSMADIDAFGAAIGLYCICNKMGKRANIVINNVTSSVRPFMERFRGKEDYPDSTFVDSGEAMALQQPTTAVIVVDVNTAARTECPELLINCRTKIVFDHHRSSSNPISDTLLAYVDPNASSSCEMVTEMIQYVNLDVKLNGVEADAIYAGMWIDTQGFMTKTGPRTFEAAAYLRRNGADITRVRKLLRTDMKEYREIAQTVSRAEIYRDAYAISVFRGDGVESPTEGGAKAANRLLDIEGIKASFVVTPYAGQMYISARSINESNVQLIMERMGGGGHMNTAGAQLKNCTEEQAVGKIKDTLDAMLKEGIIK
ncbi:MAG: DHH family phosphoesterase [Lachnospiraceae bacterium]|jgi:c-di-AMP phosphodiesterase-like protein